MELINSITKDFIDARIKLWNNFASAKNHLEKIKTEIDQILEETTSVVLSNDNYINSLSDELKKLFSSLEKIIVHSNENKKRIKNFKKEIHSIEKQISIVKKEFERYKQNIFIAYIFIFLIFPYFLIKNWKLKVTQLEEELNLSTRKKNDLKGEINNQNTQIIEFRDKAIASLESFKNLVYKYYKNKLNDLSMDVNESLQQKPYKYMGWSQEVWSNWDSNKGDICKELCVGKYSENLSLTFELPAYIPFIGLEKCTFLQSNNEKSKSVNALMESLILRIALMLPHQVIFTFLDPSGFGKAFPISGQLDTRENNGDVNRVCEDIMADIQRIITTYGLSDEIPFDSISENILINERFEIIFVAEFPKQYDRRTIESLQRIANTGHIAGKYIFFQWNQDFSLPRDISMEGFENKFTLDLITDNRYGGTQCKFSFTPDNKPDDTLKAQLLESLKNSKPPERKVEYSEEVEVPHENWWKKSSIEFIETPVGRSGSKEKLMIWFGAKQTEGGRPCAHGMLAAMTGSGKSNLYHVLILGLASRYNPKEISFFLIDGKDGVEFQPYKNLPHAQFVSLKSQPKLSRSILEELIEEKERRNSLFTKYGVNDYESFRKLNLTTEILPRILLMVDEYQELFEGDKEGLASNNLLALAQQGRSAGIHMLLGSQRFNVVGMLHESAIFGNVHLRIAMKMALSDRQALDQFGKEGKQMIATCNLPGKAVINDQSGDDGANRFGKVALMSKALREGLIEKFSQKAYGNGLPKEFITTNIFNGSEQPALLENPQLKYLISANKWLSELDFESFAREEIHKGGLGEVGWFAGEKPIVCWLGQEFNVRGHTKVILRRRQRENVLLVGDYNEVRFGMLLSMITSFVLNSESSHNEFYIVDKTIPGAPWNKSLSYIKDQLLFQLNFMTNLAVKTNQIAEILKDIGIELEKRIKSDEDENLKHKNIFLIMTEADKVDSLCQVPNKYGTFEDSELGKKLQEIYVKGPSVGIYTILTFESVMSLLNIISKKNMDYFRHRVALQMSEDDSFTFLKRREASRLQSEGNKPICSFYLDLGNNRYSIFKPYSLSDRMYEEIMELKSILKRR